MHPMPVISKPVGRMSSLGEFDLPGVVPGGGASSDAHSALQNKGLQAPGSEMPRNPTDRKMAQGDMRMTGLIVIEFRFRVWKRLRILVVS